MTVGTSIAGFGNFLHLGLNGIRTILTKIFSFLPYDSQLIMYLILFIAGLGLSYWFFKKVITFNPLSGKNILWLLLIALLIFIILAFV